MRNGKTLKEAIEKGYVKELWIEEISNQNELLNTSNHIVNGNVQFMEINLVGITENNTNRFKPEKIIELKEMAEREKALMTLIKKGFKAQKEGKTLFEFMIALGKDKKSADGIEYLDPCDSDALDINETAYLLAIMCEAINNMVPTLLEHYKKPQEEFTPEPIAMAYHWNSKDENNMPECAHIHLLLAGIINQ